MGEDSKTRKRFVGILLGVLVFVLACVPLYKEAAAAIKTFRVNAYMKSPMQIKIGWQNQDVDKYVVYRADAKADGRIGKYERIGAVSGKKRSYVDRFASLELLEEIWNKEVEWEGRYYSYKVYGYKKIEGKYTQVCEGQRMVYTGEWNTIWDEYQRSDAIVTPESIPLIVCAGSEFKPEYYRIYRSEDGKSFKMLTEIKSRNYSVNYIDENVETGKSYYYRARTYRMAGEEKIFSDYTEILKFSAENKVGIFPYKMLTPANIQTSELLMQLSSNEKNGDLIFILESLWNNLYYYTHWDYAGEAVDVELAFVAYSYDNQNWKDLSDKEVRDEKLTVKPGETIYLRFATKDGSEFWYVGEEKGVATLRYEETTYNDFYSALWFEAEKGSAMARIIGEYYH